MKIASQWGWAMALPLTGCAWIAEEKGPNPPAVPPSPPMPPMVVRSPPPPTPAPATAAPAPLVVEYKVTDPASARPLVAGTTELSRGAATFRQTPPGAPGIEIRLQAEPAGDDVIVRVHYRESGGKGPTVEWEPAVRLKRNAQATVVADGPAGGRELTVTVR